MNKIKSLRFIILPVFAVAAGLAAGFLRKIQLVEAYDSQNLPIDGHPITLALVLTALISALILLCFTRTAKGRDLGSYEQYYVTRSNFYFVSAALSSAFLIASSVLSIMETWVSSTGIFTLLMAWLSLFSGLCILIHSFSCFHARKNASAGFLLLMPILYFCLRLIYTFRGWSADPIVMDYIFELMALITTAMALYGFAGFFFGEIRISTTVYFSLLSVLFSLITLFDSHSLAVMLTYAFSALFCLASAVHILHRNDLINRGSGGKDGEESAAAQNPENTAETMHQDAPEEFSIEDLLYNE